MAIRITLTKAAQKYGLTRVALESGIETGDLLSIRACGAVQLDENEVETFAARFLQVSRTQAEQKALTEYDAHAIKQLVEEVHRLRAENLRLSQRAVWVFAGYAKKAALAIVETLCRLCRRARSMVPGMAQKKRGPFTRANIKGIVVGAASQTTQRSKNSSLMSIL